MTILEDRTALAVKKHAGAKLRSAGVPSPEGFTPHGLDWSDLNKRQRTFADVARGVLDSIRDGDDEERVADLGRAHEGLMALWDACEDEKNHRTAQGDRRARSEPARSSRRPIPHDTRDGDGDGEEIAYALRPEERMAEWVQRTGGVAFDEPLTAGAYLRSMVTGPRNDVERRALSEGTDSAGGYTVPDILSAQVIDRLRAQSVLVRAGAKTVPLKSDQNYIAKIATDPTPAWRAENAAIGESDPTFTRVAMQPKSLAVIVRVSREVLMDSLNIEQALLNSLTAAMALELDRAGLFGSGSGSEPQGLVNMSGVGEIEHDGELANYAPLIAARTMLLTANAGEPTAFIMHPREDGTLTGLVDGQGQPLQAHPKVAAIPQLVTTSVPTNGGTGTNESQVIGGDFNRFLIGIRHDLQIGILKERYADLHQYAFVAHLRATFAAEHTSAFVKVTGIQPGE